MTERTLSAGVASAIADILAEKVEISVADAIAALPAHIAAARPSKKSVVAAIVRSGWRGVKVDGAVIYRAPQTASDPLRQDGGEGHNIAAEELRLLIERAERLEEEKKGIADDIKDVFAEAKGRGYDPKAIKQIMRIRSKTKEEWQDEQAILETYMIALGMV